MRERERERAWKTLPDQWISGEFSPEIATGCRGAQEGLSQVGCTFNHSPIIGPQDATAVRDAPEGLLSVFVTNDYESP